MSVAMNFNANRKTLRSAGYVAEGNIMPKQLF